MADLPDQQTLWRKFKRGSQSAFSTMYQHYYSPLYFYALKTTGDQETAQECVQELFVVLWQSRTRLGDVASVKPYLFKSLRGILHRQVTSQRKYCSLLPNEGCLMLFSQEDFMIQQEEDAYRHTTLTALLNALPARQREAVYLKYYEGLSYPQIAEVLQINYQSVVNLIYQAFQQLKKQPQLQNLCVHAH